MTGDNARLANPYRRTRAPGESHGRARALSHGAHGRIDPLRSPRFGRIRQRTRRTRGDGGQDARLRRVSPRASSDARGREPSGRGARVHCSELRQRVQGRTNPVRPHRVSHGHPRPHGGPGDSGSAPPPARQEARPRDTLSGVDQRARESLLGGGGVRNRRLAGVENIYDESEERAYRLAREADAPDADAVLLSGTGLPTIGVIEVLERDLGKPVVSSNQAALWRALRLAGVRESISGF